MHASNASQRTARLSTCDAALGRCIIAATMTADLNHDSKVALVTGGGVRVGAAIVRALVDDGWRVWIHHHRSVEPARTLAAELGASRARTIAADLSRADARGELAEAVLDPAGAFGGVIDLLVNNAASFERGDFTSRTDADLERVLATNLVAPVSMTRHLAAALGRRGGSVVNIADITGMHPVLGYADHCIAKAGLEMATRALAAELAPVRVNAVAPGTVAWPTDEHHAPGSALRAAIERTIPAGRIGTPADIAQAVRFLAGAPFVSGTCLVVDGGRTAAIAGGRDGG
jgi:pteridine reductase